MSLVALAGDEGHMRSETVQFVEVAMNRSSVTIVVTEDPTRVLHFETDDGSVLVKLALATAGPPADRSQSVDEERVPYMADYFFLDLPRCEIQEGWRIVRRVGERKLIDFSAAPRDAYGRVKVVADKVYPLRVEPIDGSHKGYELFKAMGTLGDGCAIDCLAETLPPAAVGRGGLPPRPFGLLFDPGALEGQRRRGLGG